MSNRLRDEIGRDQNIVAAGLLQDLALLQPSERSHVSDTKRAAKAIAAAIDRPIVELIAEGSLRDIPYVGAASERVAAANWCKTLAHLGARRARRGRLIRGAAKWRKRRRYRRAWTPGAATACAWRWTRRSPRRSCLRASYAGDLQMHSTWSDGVESIADLAEGAIELGWTRIGVTDHSYGLPIARGMSDGRGARGDQHHEVDALNERLAGRLRV